MIFLDQTQATPVFRTILWDPLSKIATLFSCTLAMFFTTSDCSDINKVSATTSPAM
jgi:hypothetical protein